MKMHTLNQINSAIRSLLNSTDVVIAARGSAATITSRNRQLLSRREVEYSYFQPNGWNTFHNGKYGIAVDVTQFHTAGVDEQAYGLAFNRYLGEWHITNVPRSLVQPLIAEAERYFGRFPEVWEDTMARVGVIMPKVFGWVGHQRPILCKVNYWGKSNFQEYASWKCSPDVNVPNLWAHNIMTEDEMYSVMELYSATIAYGADGRPYIFYLGWRDEDEPLSRGEEEILEKSVYTDISPVEDAGRYIRAIAPYEGDLPEAVSPIHLGDFIKIRHWLERGEPRDFTTVDGVKGVLWAEPIFHQALSYGNYIQSGDISKLMSPFYRKTSPNHHIVVEVTESEIEADALIRYEGVEALFIRE